MSGDEIKKPSLTQRKKSGDTLSSMVKKSSSKKDPSTIKLTSSSLSGRLLDRSHQDSSDDDISLGKVVLVVLAVVIVAVVSAFLVQRLQSPSTETIGDNPNSNDGVITDNSNKNKEVTPTPEVSVAPTTIPTIPLANVTSSTGTSLDLTTDNQYGKTVQYLAGGLDGNIARIRTYQFEDVSNVYEFRLPFDDGSGGDIKVPNVKASYNAEGKLVVDVSNIKSFSSCTYLNEHNSIFAYDNVELITCTASSGMYTFTFNTIVKTAFKLTTGTTKIGDIDVNAIIIKIKNQ